MDFKIGGRGHSHINKGDLFHSTLDGGVEQVFMRLVFDPDIITSLMADGELLLCVRLNGNHVGELATFKLGSRYIKLTEQDAIKVEEG